MAGLRIDHYDWRGGREAMLRFGPTGGPVVVAALPLFEEANRTRAFVMTLLRTLAARGIASALPDLPGQGESLIPIGDVALADLTEAMAAAVASVQADHPRSYALGIRSGALLAGDAVHHGRWSLAPQDGPGLARELVRLAGLSTTPNEDRDHVDIAGNSVSATLLSDLATARPPAQPGPTRVIRLATDPGAADRTVEGRPLWRRSEPGNDPALATLLADDIADWIRACEA